MAEYYSLSFKDDISSTYNFNLYKLVSASTFEPAKGLSRLRLIN